MTLPTSRCAVSACVLLLISFGVGGCRDGGASGGASLAGTPAGGAIGTPPIGDPLAPLPAPAPAPEGGRMASAVALAAQVREGGDRGAAALLTALRLSGIAVRGANGTMLVEPARPFQGTVVEAWEIRPLVALARERRTVLIPLEELGGALRVVFPGLEREPVEQHLLDGVRRHATDEASPLAFWASFVSALGGDGALSEADLTAAAEPRDVVINGLQASLLVRRLSTDLLVAAHPPRAGSRLLAPLRWLAPRPLHAAAASAQCRMTETEQTIADLTAFGSGVLVGGAQVGDLGFPGLIGYLKNKAVAGAEAFDRLSKGASVLLAYAQFMHTYGALEAEIALDDPPLPRTREPRPRSGERRNLVAVVQFATGDEQAVNCFRMMFNAAGLDLSLRQSGPAKGSTVAWRGVSGFNQAAEALHRGPEAIVQFVDDPANRIQDGGEWRFTSANAVVNQKVGDDGTVRIAVEGRGQKQPLPPNVGRVAKQATVAIQVAVKGADLFGDMKDASSTAMGGGAALLAMPVELLYRMKWATAATLTFPVLDWGKGKGWSGTVDVIIRTSGGGKHPLMPNTTYKGTRATQVRFDFTNGVGSWTASESRWRFEEMRIDSRECPVMLRGNVLTKLGGSGPAVLEVGEEGPPEEDRPQEDDDTRVAFVQLSYSPERTAVGTGGLELTGTDRGTRVTCGLTERVDDEASRGYYPLGSVYARIPDPMKQTELTGSATWPFEDEGEGTKGIITMTWKLRRT